MTTNPARLPALLAALGHRPDLDLTTPPTWHAVEIGDGTQPCALATETWFPGKGESAATARRWCRRCEFTERCLIWAVHHPEVIGVWGGTTERDRRQLRHHIGTEIDTEEAA